LGPPRAGTGAGFFFRPAGGAGGADDGGIDHPQVAAELAVLVEVVQKGGEDLGPGAVLAPAVEAVVDGLPGAVAARDVASGGAGVQPPEDPIEETAVGLPRASRAPVVAGVREVAADALPLPVLEFITASHGRPPFGNQPADTLGTLVL
jgi:hypothetical protein